MEIRSENQLVDIGVILADERSGFFVAPSEGNLPRDIVLKNRSIVVSWLLMTNKFFHFKLETYLKGVRILDAYLCRTAEPVLSKMQLISTACLSLASSHNEIFPPHSSEYVFAARNGFTDDQLDDMRNEVFKTIGCSVSIPVEIEFLRIISDLSEVVAGGHKLATNILATCAIAPSDYLPSVVATAAAYIANKLVGGYTMVNAFDVPQNIIEDCASKIVDTFVTLGKSTLLAYTTIDAAPVWNVNIANIEKLKFNKTASGLGPYITQTYFKPLLSMELLPNDVLEDGADYLGKGTFGVVTKATYKGVEYAVKTSIKLDDFSLTQSLCREISVMLSLDHENVVKIHHISEDLASVFLPLGRSDLSAWVKHNGAYSIENQIDLAKQLLGALVYIHRCGVLHRDIKPQNIIVYREDERLVYKLSDFGSARGCDLALNTGPYTTLICTLWYRSPELLLGDTSYGDRLDVWSMCCTLYECATNSVLFKRMNESDMIRWIYSILGKPTEASWPGVSKLQSYGQVTGNWHKNPRYFSSDNQLSPLYKEIMEAGLVMNPNKRASSEDLYKLTLKY